jgi:hypothetical protein
MPIAPRTDRRQTWFGLDDNLVEATRFARPVTWRYCALGCAARPQATVRLAVGQ